MSAQIITPSESALRLRHLASHLRGFAYRYHDEIQLHGVLESVLIEAGEKSFVREFSIDRKNRFDFWFPDEGLAIEVKVDGTLSSALRQVDRYCMLPNVRGVLLASTLRWAGIEISALHGVPVYGVHLQRQCL